MNVTCPRLGRDAVAAAFTSERDPLHRLARALAARGAVDTKEWLEAAELFHRLRRRLRRHTLVDLAAGHGLMGLLFGAFEPTVQRVVLVDRRRPPSYQAVLEAACEVAPWLLAKVTYLQVWRTHVRACRQHGALSGGVCSMSLAWGVFYFSLTWGITLFVPSPWGLWYLSLTWGIMLWIMTVLH